MNAFIAFALGSALFSQVKTSSMSEDEETTAAQHVKNDCMACHTDQMLEQQRLTPAQWEAVVGKMRRWGAPTEEQFARLVIRYLSIKHPAGAPLYAPESMESKKALAWMGRLPDGKYKGGSAKDGKAAYEKLCASCHAPDGRGGDFGVALTQRTVVWRAEDFAAVVRGGRGRMPAFAESTDKEIASLLAHLRTLRD